LILLAALLAAAAAPATAVDAERKFAAMAQTQGQWTAFRAFAAADGITFAPKPVNAQALFKTLKDPPPGLMWWPGRSWVACDGSLAVNTGPWLRRGKATGTFTTVWQRQADGDWKWLLDHGRETPRAVAASDQPQVVRASCRNLAAAASATPDPARLSPGILYQADNAMPTGRPPAVTVTETGRIGGGASPDGSFVWRLDAVAGEEGAHRLRLWLWDGRAHRLALEEVTGVKAGG
jgi:hypothetical protein